MKLKFYLICSICLLSTLLLSTTWHIKQDGTGNFITIQEGIDFCANSDTLLVYPGIYFENLVIIEKAITLGSLYLTTGDESYISQTMIDGFQNECVVRIESVPNWNEVYISGFIIQNGIGYMHIPNRPDKRRGGGFNIDAAAVTIFKCIIQNNKAAFGGGIYLYENVNLSFVGNTVKYNRALKKGGGIYMAGCVNISYSTEILNNIYLNFAGVASDIFVSYLSPFQEIGVDTFTVIDPAEGYYFIYPASGGAGFPQPGLFSIDIQNAKIEQVDQDLYVSADGDNSNSGISADEPLQSIAYALAMIRSDSLMQKTIHVTDGVYSVSQNDQYFPLHLKSYVSIVGESRENTILDAELYGGHIYAYDPQRDYAIKNLALINSRNQDNITIGENTGGMIDNVKITGHHDTLAESSFCGLKIYFTDISINNLVVENNLFVGGLYYYSPKYGSELNITNSIFRNNAPSVVACKQLFCYRSASLSDSLIVNVINTEITDNLDASYEWPPAEVGIFITQETKANIINCTIGNNECINNGAAVHIMHDSEANIINSVLYGDTPYEICLNSINGACSLYAYNSLIDGGIGNILQLGYNFINWDDETMLDEDPLWLGPGADWPYALSEDSPCIDTGTLELPPGIELPEFDLAGNPRIVNGMVDMGAYEYQDSVSVKENIFKPITQTKISSYPNPFNPSTKISLSLPESGNIKLEIFNVKGQKVKTLMDAYSCKGHFEIIWRSTDDNGKKVASGNYFAKLKVNDKTKAVRKLILLK